MDIFSLVIQEGHGWRDAELPENLIAVVVVPHLGDLPVNDAEPAPAMHQDVLTRGTNKPVAFTGMSAFGGPGDSNNIAVDGHLIGSHLEIRRRRAPSFALRYGCIQAGGLVVVVNNAVAGVDLRDCFVASAVKEIVKNAPRDGFVLFRRHLDMSGQPGSFRWRNRPSLNCRRKHQDAAENDKRHDGYGGLLRKKD